MAFHASDLIRPSDIEVWVKTGIRAGMPEFESCVSSALQRQESILHEVVMTMVKSMDNQARLMQRTIAVQARSLILCGALIGVATDRELTRMQKVGYGLLGIFGFFVLERLQEGYVSKAD
eukprot:gene200-41_t